MRPLPLDQYLLVGFLSGAIFIASVTVACFFCRGWKRNKDPLLLCFAIAFGLIGIERVSLTFADHTLEISPFFYLIRLTAFLLIIFGALHKNLKSKI